MISASIVGAWYNIAIEVKHMARKKKKYNPIKAQAASRRKAHFAAGGTTAMWRGRAVTLDESTSKARKYKVACRGRVNIDHDEV